MSLRARTIIVTVAIATIPVCLLGYLLHQSTVHEVEAEHRERLTAGETRRPAIQPDGAHRHAREG